MLWMSVKLFYQYIHRLVKCNRVGTDLPDGRGRGRG